LEQIREVEALVEPDEAQRRPLDDQLAYPDVTAKEREQVQSRSSSSQSANGAAPSGSAT